MMLPVIALATILLVPTFHFAFDLGGWVAVAGYAGMVAAFGVVVGVSGRRHHRSTRQFHD